MIESVNVIFSTSEQRILTVRRCQGEQVDGKREGEGEVEGGAVDKQWSSFSAAHGSNS